LRVHVSGATFNRRDFHTAVVVDVFRSSTTIVTALNNGARAIVPFTRIAEAIKFRNADEQSDVVLVGERNGITPKGFDYNISPFDMTRKNIAGKTIGYSSTNLTRVVGKLKGPKVIVGGIVNARATARYLSSLGEDVSIIACGTREGPTVEDLAGAGAIASHVVNAELSDEALAAVGLHKTLGLRKLVKQGRIARRLIGLGYERDINFCLTPDSSQVVAGLVGKQIVDLRSRKERN
jgi:2-phosphosulfolactate phosphatase